MFISSKLLQRENKTKESERENYHETQYLCDERKKQVISNLK